MVAAGSTSIEREAAIISLHKAEKIYPPDQRALSPIDLRVRRGEFVFVAGASGAGKSTFLKLISGQERASGGSVIVGGRNLAAGVTSDEEFGTTPVSRAQLAEHRRRVGVIFQDYKLLPTLSILENVAFALEALGVRKRERLQRAFKLLSAVGLKDRVHARPQTLSGGEQQRVSIARALVNTPEIILADEPTGNLDPDMTLAVFRLLVEANKCGATVIVASHNLSLIEEMNKRTLVLDHGKIIGDFERPKGSDV